MGGAPPGRAGGHACGGCRGVGAEREGNAAGRGGRAGAKAQEASATLWCATKVRPPPFQGRARRGWYCIGISCIIYDADTLMTCVRCCAGQGEPLVHQPADVGCAEPYPPGVVALCRGWFRLRHMDVVLLFWVSSEAYGRALRLTTPPGATSRVGVS